MVVTGYASFAAFYDAVQGDRAEAAAFARSLLARHAPAARTVLELACGTGSILAALRSDYDVVGVDLSEEMLAVARRKLPGVELIHADMTRVRLGRRFDAVLCLYDSINHLLRWTQWEAVFDRARMHLEPGGVFVFDVNTPRRLEALAAAQPAVQWFDTNVLLLDVRDVGRGVVDWQLQVFERRGEARYRLHQETIPERGYPAERIRDALARRFRRVYVIDPARARPSARSGRLWFVAREPLPRRLAQSRRVTRRSRR
jgi:SAM-dependent methyltransferase